MLTGTIDSVTVSNVPISKNVNQEQRDEEQQSIVNAMGNGDTVEISEEAQQLLNSVQSVNSGEGVEGETVEDNAPSGAPPSQPPAAAGGSEQASSESSTSTSEDDATDLEEEISALRQEIAALAAQAATDETAQAELSAKQSEMVGLLAELAQLQAQ